VSEGPSTATLAASSREPVGFDFRHPGKSASDGIDRLESAHDAFVESFQRLVAKRTGLQIRLEFQTVEQIGFGRYLRSMGPPAVLTAFKMAPYPGRAVIEIGSSVGLSMIDVLLGGSGESGPGRRLTDIENVLMSEVEAAAFEALGNALGSLGLEPEVEIENADPIQLAIQAGRDFVVVLQYRIAIGDDIPPQERLVLAYPVTVLHDIAEGGAPGGRDERVRSGRAAIEQLLPGLKVPFAVRLQPSQVRFTDLANLQPGDVLRLDHSVEDTAIGLVGDIPTVEGRLGATDGHMALRVTGWLDDTRGDTS